MEASSLAPLDRKDAIRSYMKESERERNGYKVRRRTFVFMCRGGCGNEVHILGHKVVKQTGYCRDCWILLKWPVRTCTTDGCNLPCEAQGLCKKHYTESMRTNGEGYLTPEHRRKYEHTWCRTFNGRWSALKNAVRATGLSSDISKQDHESLLRNVCTYCGGELSPAGHGLDRKQPLLGYTRDNVVPCCATCNRMKNTFLTYEEMVFVTQQLRAFRSAVNTS